MFVVPIWIIAYEPKAIFFYLISNFVPPSNIVDELKVSDTIYLDGNLFRKYTTPYISDIFIRIVYLLDGTEWNVAPARYLILHIDR